MCFSSISTSQILSYKKSEFKKSLDRADIRSHTKFDENRSTHLASVQLYIQRITIIPKTIFFSHKNSSTSMFLLNHMTFSILLILRVIKVKTSPQILKKTAGQANLT